MELALKVAIFMGHLELYVTSIRQCLSKRGKEGFMRRAIVVLVSIACLSAAAAAEESYGPLSERDLSAVSQTPASPLASLPEEAMTLVEVQGQVDSVDEASRSLHVTDSLGRPVVVQVLPGTRIMNGQNRDLRLSELRPDDRVRIYYNRDNGAAQQVDRLPSPVGVLLGVE
jgi:hypothetical protein